MRNKAPGGSTNMSRKSQPSNHLEKSPEQSVLWLEPTAHDSMNIG